MLTQSMCITARQRRQLASVKAVALFFFRQSKNAFAFVASLVLLPSFSTKEVFWLFFFFLDVDAFFFDVEDVLLDMDVEDVLSFFNQKDVSSQAGILCFDEGD